MKALILPINIGDEQVSLLIDNSGVLVDDSGHIRIFPTIEDAKQVYGDESQIWPDSGSVDLAFTKSWISDPKKSAASDVLSRLANVDAVYTNILISYSDFKPEDIPNDIVLELDRCHQETISGKRDPLNRLANLTGQEQILEVACEQGWDTDKLIRGWGGIIQSDWSSDELDQIARELIVEIDFIEKVLQGG